MAQNNKELFIKEYQKLVEKYKVDMATFPVFVPGEKQGTFTVVIQSVPVDMEEYEKNKKKDAFISKAD